METLVVKHPRLNINDKKTLFDNIVFIGDPHGNYEPIYNIVKQRRPAIIFILGDMEYGGIQKKLLGDTLLYGIMGNHDDGEIENITYFDLKIVDVSGIRIFGLPGGFHRNTIELIKQQGRIDIIVSHYPPREYAGQEVFEATRALMYFHGHYHSCKTKFLNGPYAGCPTHRTDELGSLPTINVTDSAMDMNLQRVDPELRNYDRCSMFVDSICDITLENESKRKRSDVRHKLYSGDRVERKKFVEKNIRLLRRRLLKKLKARMISKARTPRFSGHIDRAIRYGKSWKLVDKNGLLLSQEVDARTVRPMSNKKQNHIIRIDGEYHGDPVIILDEKAKARINKRFVYNKERGSYQDIGKAQ